jgi:hypothetical protein
MSNVSIDRPPSRSASFLRLVLLVDAGASGATGLLAVLGAGALAGLLGMPATFLRGAGLLLVPYVAFVAFVATRERLPRPAIWAIIACNALWAVASIAPLASGILAPSALGYAFVTAQALIVALLGGLQYLGLQRQIS